MAKFGKTVAILAVLLGVELAREWFVLRNLGFEPGRFVDWEKGE